MRVLVCGGRDYSNKVVLERELDTMHGNVPFSALIEGDARGADRLARNWAKQKGIPCITFPADWDTYGKSAGHKRNLQMILEGKPDLCIAFPGGKGTCNMVEQCNKHKVGVILIHD